ncbi:YetF domain-containing protein [Variovorax paradoxus]|uniref:YetF domain-containing protein n=1 Tax=Variovorax paradoxus TaxID=34073 RepID=UPI0019349D53|nr:DUF421 domain-containing protein [Variovorax paradoxus]
MIAFRFLLRRGADQWAWRTCVTLIAERLEQRKATRLRDSREWPSKHLNVDRVKPRIGLAKRPSSEGFSASAPSAESLVKHGKIIQRPLQRKLTTNEKLMSKLREKWISNLSDVRMARVESDGKLSVFRYWE